jgi:hypothetical protein
MHVPSTPTEKPPQSGLLLKRLMGLELTTFCTAIVYGVRTTLASAVLCRIGLPAITGDSPLLGPPDLSRLARIGWRAAAREHVSILMTVL